MPISKNTVAIAFSMITLLVTNLLNVGKKSRKIKLKLNKIHDIIYTQIH